MRRFVLVLIALAACDEENPVRHLDGGVDARVVPIDAPDPDAPVTLTVRRGATGVEGVKVLFQNPDSSLVSSTTTDANGVASARLPDGGFVTAVDPFPVTPGGPSVELRTFAGVEPGDQLLLEEAAATATTPVTITTPNDPDASVVDYLIGTACDQSIATSQGSAAPTTTIHAFDPACLAGTDVLVASRDQVGDIVHWTYAPDSVPVADTIDLSAAAITGTPTSKMFSFANVPGTVYLVGVAQHLASSKGMLAQLDAFATGTPLQAAFEVPAFTGALDVAVTTGYYNFGHHHLFDWGPVTGTAAVDLGARVLTEVTDTPAIDMPGQRVTWPVATGGQPPDFAVTYLTASRDAPARSWAWLVTAPYSPGTVQLPTLPVEAGVDYNLTTAARSDLQMLLLGRMTGGYDAVRAGLQNVSGPQDLVVGATGAFEVQDVFPFPPTRRAPSPRDALRRGAWKFRHRM